MKRLLHGNHRSIGALTILVLLALGCLAPPVRAQDDGGTQSPFVLGSGAREQAMGRAAVALSRHAEALFWNPARLTSVLHPELSLYRSELFVDGSAYHTGFMAYPTLDFGVFSVGYQRIDVSGLQRRDDRNQLLGEFSNSESNLLLGYGRSFGRLFSVGAALRIAQQNVENYSDAAVGLDIGAGLSKPLDPSEKHRINLGANIQNAVEPKIRLLNEDVEDPRHLRLGAGYEGANADDRFAWAVGADVVLASKADWTGGVGGELTYARTLSLRAGMDGSNPTFGLGLQWRQVRFDYALRTDDVLPRNDRFTLAVHFGTSVRERRDARRQAQNQEVTNRLAQLLQERESQELQRALEAADTAFEAEQWQEALRLYRRVLVLDPEHAHAIEQRDALDVYLRLVAAGELLDNGQAAQAAGLYQGILTEFPGEGRAQDGLDRARAVLQARADRSEALRELFREALDQFAQKNYPGAQASLRELLHLDPQYELALDLQQRIAEAIEERGEDALRDAQRLAGNARYDAALRRLDDAASDLGEQPRIIQMRADWQKAKIALAQRAREKAERERALAAASQRVEDTAPRAPRRLTPEERRELQRKYQEGLSAFTRSDFDAAIRNWHAVWFVDPNYENVSGYLIKAYLFQGVELYGRGRYDEALDRCKRVLEIDPTNEKALRYLDRIEEEKLEIEEIERGKTGE